ncbi:MAG TPA: MlaD family protein [Thermoleophilaceae bacterium]|jgi:ABC-type transporter Mla subunit MlaD
MTRRPNASIVASPVLIGAVAVLVVVVSVVLAYNANKGLPFVPSLDVNVQAGNALSLGRGGEVREGGNRVGFVEKVRSVKLPNGEAGAEFDLKLDKSVGDLPADTTFTIRPRSPLGLKYLEMQRGKSDTGVRQGHTFPASQTTLPVEIDDFNRIYDERTRQGVRRNTEGFGTAFAGRGMAINDTVGELPRLFGYLAPVAQNLASPRTQIGRFFRELSDAARVVSPLAEVQSEFFTRAGDTFEALSRDTNALKETISRSHPLFQAGIESFPVQRPFLSDSARLARAMRPVARELRPTLPVITPALERGIPVTRRSVEFYADLKPTLVSLRDLMTDPATGIALRALGGTSKTLQPQLKFLGPFQTVCNYWNYWWSFLAEHLSAESGQGFSQRTESKSAAPQTNNQGSMGAYEPVNYQGYNESMARRGSNMSLHSTPYNHAITGDGAADCENGQRGWLHRYTTVPEPEFLIQTRADIPGVQGPTYAGRKRVPAGQTFAREPQGKGHVHVP